MQIEYYTKQVYGKDLHYIKDPTISKNFTALTGSKTISAQQMRDFTNITSGHITFKQVIN